MGDKEFTGQLVNTSIVLAASNTDQFTGEVRVKDRGILSLDTTDLAGIVTLQYKTDLSTSWQTLANISVHSSAQRYEFNGYGDRHRAGVFGNVTASNFGSGSGMLFLKG